MKGEVFENSLDKTLSINLPHNEKSFLLTLSFNSLVLDKYELKGFDEFSKFKGETQSKKLPLGICLKIISWEILFH